MTPEEYRDKVTVIITPDGEHEHGPRGGLAKDTLFWLHTVGLNKLKRPELEMRQVPAIAVRSAHAMLNEWGLYSLTEKFISPDELIQTNQGVPFLFKTLVSDDPFWEGRGICLRLEVEEILFSCGGNHGKQAVN